MRRGSKRVFGAGVIGGLVYAGWRAWRARVPTSVHDISWENAPFPFPPVPRPGKP